MKRKWVSLLLSAAMCMAMAVPGTANAEEMVKHVENLVIGTTAENNVFNSQTQSDAFGRMNYNGLTQGNFVYRDENNELQPYFLRVLKFQRMGNN